MRRLLSFLVVLLTAGVSVAQTVDQLPEVTADRFQVDFDSGAAVWSGNARIQLPDGLLTADELRYLHRSRTVEARGQVVLDQGDRRLLAQSLRYGLDSRRYEVRNFRFGAPPIYVSGTLVDGDRGTFVFNDALVSYGEPSRWAPTFTADSVTYFQDRERMRASGAAVGLGFWQPLPLPATELPTHLNFLTYLSFRAGYSNQLGAHVEVGVRVPLNESVSVGGDIGYFTERGVLLGPSASYSFGRSPERRARGEFTSGYIRDSGDKFVDIRQQPVPEDRGFVTWQHQQRLGRALTFDALLNYWSDSEVLRDFRPSDFFSVQTPDSFAEVTHVTDNGVLAFFARPHVNPYHTVRERLPELTYQLLPTPLASGIYHELQVGAVRLRDDPPMGGPTLRSDRLDAYYALTRPFTPREWLSVAPVVGARVTHYDRTLPGSGRSDYTRALGEFGLDAEMRVSGTFDYRNERWDIDGLRHLVTPRISYRYIPDATKGAAYIPPIDRRVFGTYLEPLGLGARRQIDDLTATNTLRLAVDNRLQTRDARFGSRDLLEFNLAADVRFDQPAGQRTLSDLHTEARLHPAHWLTIDAYHRLDPDGGRTEEFNLGITVLNADRWAVRFGNHYLVGDIQEHLLGVSYRLNEVFELYSRLHYDARRERFNEQSYGVRQTIDNRWIVGYQLSFFDGRRREGDFRFSLLLEAFTF